MVTSPLSTSPVILRLAALAALTDQRLRIQAARARLTQALLIEDDLPRAMLLVQQALNELTAAPSVEVRMLGRVRAHRVPRRLRRRLSAIEMTILHHVEQGLTNQQIADEMDVNVDAVRYQLQSASWVLGTHTKLAAVIEAQKIGYDLGDT